MEKIVDDRLEENIITITRAKFLYTLQTVDTRSTKVLILDKETAHILNNFVEMTDILNSGISLVESILVERQPLPHLDAIYFISPTSESIEKLIEDFQDPDTPKYHSAHVFFHTACEDKQLQKIAQERVVAKIKTLKEANIDFIGKEGQLFKIESDKSFFNLYSPDSSSAKKELQKLAKKIVTVCATLGEFPIVRYAKSHTHSSALAQYISEGLERLRRAKALLPSGERATLIVLDRTHDLITPLLHDFCYQSMVYDILGIHDDKYQHTYTDASSNEAQVEAVLDDKDKVWAAARYQHIEYAKKFIAKTFQQFVDENKAGKFAKEKNVKKDLSSLSDIVRAMPKYQKLYQKFSLHINLAKKCMDLFNKGALEKVASIEQDIATGRDERAKKIENISKKVLSVINDDFVSTTNKMRMLLLWLASSVTETDAKLDKLIKDIVLDDMDTLERALKNLSQLKKTTSRKDQKRIPKNGEWEFVLSRFVPALRDMLDELLSNKLNSKDFPFVNEEDELGSANGTPTVDRKSRRKETAGNKWANDSPAVGRKDKESNPLLAELKRVREPPRVIIFIAGGVSPAECKIVSDMSKQYGRDIIIGSTHVIFPDEFVHDLADLGDGTKRAASVSSSSSSNSSSDSSDGSDNASSSAPPPKSNGRQSATKQPASKQPASAKPASAKPGPRSNNNRKGQSSSDGSDSDDGSESPSSSSDKPASRRPGASRRPQSGQATNANRWGNAGANNNRRNNNKRSDSSSGDSVFGDDSTDSS
jgi:hypothetical protein